MNAQELAVAVRVNGAMMTETFVLQCSDPRDWLSRGSVTVKSAKEIPDLPGHFIWLFCVVGQLKKFAHRKCKGATVQCELYAAPGGAFFLCGKVTRSETGNVVIECSPVNFGVAAHPTESASDRATDQCEPEPYSLVTLHSLWRRLRQRALIPIATRTVGQCPPQRVNKLERLLTKLKLPHSVQRDYRLFRFDCGGDPDNLTNQFPCGVTLVEYEHTPYGLTLDERITCARQRIPNAFRLSQDRRKSMRYVQKQQVDFAKDPHESKWPANFLEGRAPEVPTKFRQATRQAIEQRGIDALGWYRSFHHSRGKWGIYLAEKRLLAVALDLNEALASAGKADLRLAMWAVTQFVLSHEQFHARLDQVCLRLETDARRAMYLPYSRNVYRPALRTIGPREECLAEHEAHVRLADQVKALEESGTLSRATSVSIKRFMEDLSDRAPVGYRDWRQGYEPETWRALLQEVCTGLPYSKGQPLAPPEEILRQPPREVFLPDEVPVRVQERGILDNAFLRPEKRRVLAREFLDGGFCEEAALGKGSHTTFVHKDGRQFILPHGVDIDGSIARNARRVIAMTPEQWRTSVRGGRAWRVGSARSSAA